MKKILIGLFFVLLVVLAITLEKPDKIEVYQLDGRLRVMEETLITYTDPRIVQDFVVSFDEAKKVKGGEEVPPPPSYLVKIKDHFYSLWIEEDGGMIMNYNDTQTYFSLSKSGARKVYNALVTSP